MKASGRKWTYKVGIAAIVAILFKGLFFRLREFLDVDLFFILAVILILWEGNLRIDKLLNKYYSWINEPRKRLVLQVVSCSLFTAVVLFDVMYIIHQIKFGDGEVFNEKMREIFIPAMFIAFTSLAIIISNQFFNALKDSLVQVENYKLESINAQLQNLKNQVNPHFLFNNLSVLTSLVYKDQDRAVDFINELSKVYRYILDNKNTELVQFQEELDFLDHYIYLLKIRFDKGISVTFNVDKARGSDYLVPMCLQMLVENAIQHNETSQSNRLQLIIYTINNSVVVKNTIQPRNERIDSSKTGLANIQLRYSYFTDKLVEIINDGEHFTVTLPLLPGK